MCLPGHLSSYLEHHRSKARQHTALTGESASPARGLRTPQDPGNAAWRAQHSRPSLGASGVSGARAGAMTTGSTVM